MALERANLFLVPLDDRRLWYRYHLFAGVLQAHLQDEEPDIVPDGPAECPGGATALVDDLPAALRVCLDPPATS